MTVLTNAQLVLADEVIQGTLFIEHGRIVDIRRDVNGSRLPPDAIDLDGDYLTPGLVDLHTDNLERQVSPRTRARWPSRSALMTHDAQCAIAGVTTVFDALCLGEAGFEKARTQTFRDGLIDLQTMATTNLLKAEHFLHLRCELLAPEMPDLLSQSLDHSLVRLVSIMDHSPGVGQYADIDRFRLLRQEEGLPDEHIDTLINQAKLKRATYSQLHRERVLNLLRERDIPLASHDDRTTAEIEQNHQDGITISEFPVSLEAARHAKLKGIRCIAGAPNIVRGGSHSGNIAATDLISEGLLDALASDYVPAAMMEAAFILAQKNILNLPAAIALVSSGPAALVGLNDRGQIASGLRADLVRVHVHDGLPVIRSVWRAGERIA
ncbi:alpha-D-ribose 1-methylphosphonate 5-triphosphate diphosphatase [Halothiobacillus sp.]|uniref:alpha-D-ribose 1-methylphosphonate 5-triphosphate diphosphatase n=1 Tax=Halothiobacillus sp. TaxID=1891311 RepID=UPI00261AA052|nr:alpha-D-ribose 1-methylphosphonate 5-triphosphate diphosphatase [Halothiobacillus sp.]